MTGEPRDPPPDAWERALAVHLIAPDDLLERVIAVLCRERLRRKTIREGSTN